MSEQDRRHHRRFQLALPLWVRFRRKIAGSAEAEEDAVLEGLPEEEETTTTAVSSGSCFFYVTNEPPLGAAAAMRVEIPLRVSGRVGRVLCQGDVVWVGDRKSGGKVGVACTIDSFRFEPPGEDENRLAPIDGTIHNTGDSTGSIFKNEVAPPCAWQDKPEGLKPL